MRPLIAGNWKMNGMARQLREIEAIAALVKAAPPLADVLICDLRAFDGQMQKDGYAL